jgi:hypothetical protein
MFCARNLPFFVHRFFFENDFVNPERIVKSNLETKTIYYFLSFLNETSLKTHSVYLCKAALSPSAFMAQIQK